MDSNTKDVGNLLKFKNVSKEDIDLFLMLLYNNKYKLLLPLRDIIDDDQKFLEVVDLFAGYRLWFPERIKTYRYLERATTYNYLKERNFSPQAYKSIAKQIDKRVIQTRSLMETVESTVNNREKMIKADVKQIKRDLDNRKKLDPLENYSFDFIEGDEIDA